MGNMLHRSAAVTAGMLFFAVGVSESAVVPGTNIETSVQPIVWTRYSGAPTPGGNNTVITLWDTGDPWETMSRETALYLNLAPITPMVPGGSGGDFRNDGTIAQ